MAIIVEDGTGVPLANSYVSEAELEQFADLRGIVLDGEPEALLHLAMDYVETLGFLGEKTASDQALQWPRTGVEIDGYLLESTVIPTELKNGVIQTALAISQGNDPQAEREREVIEESVGALGVKYAPTGESGTVRKTISAALKKLTRSTASSANFNVQRAL